MIEDLAFLSRAQAATEFRMRDTCTVTRLGLDGAFDPVTGLPVDGVPVVVYSGPCRLHTVGRAAKAAGAEVAGDAVATSEPMLSVPLSAPRIRVDDVVVITGSPSADPGRGLRLGLRFTVVGLTLGTDMSAQRVTVQSVTG